MTPRKEYWHERIQQLIAELKALDEALTRSEVLTVPEYASRFGLHPETVRRMCVRGALKATQSGPGGHWRIEVAA